MTGGAHMQKRLVRSRTARQLAGVCGGIAEYLDIDPTVVRLAWVLFSFSGGFGIFAYIVACCLIPEADRKDASE